MSILLLCLPWGRTEGRAAGDGSKAGNGSPPHVVIYLSDFSQPLSEQLDEEVLGQGILFKRVFATSDQPEYELRNRLSGNFAATSGKTLIEYLKTKGYRIVLIGDDEWIENRGDQQFHVEAVADSLKDMEIPLSVGLGKLINRLTVFDQRPTCVLIRDSTTDTSATLPQFPTTQTTGSRIHDIYNALVASLPMENTVFIASSLTGMSETAETISSSQTIITSPLTDRRINVPFLVIWKGQIQAGRSSDALVSSVDILPTLVEIIGATPPSEIDGRSFAGILRGESHEHRDVAFSVSYHDEKPIQFCVRDSRFKLVTATSSNTKKAMFDLLNDPHERHNIIDEPAFADHANELSDQLTLWLQKHFNITTGLSQE